MTAQKNNAKAVSPAQGVQETTLPANHISNADFLRSIFPAFENGEYGWQCTFSVKPDPKAPWGGSPFTDFGAVKDYPHGNAYFSVAVLKADGQRKRRKTNFSRLPVIVADDIEGQPDCTYRLQTSAGKCQVGWKLTEPIKDVGIAERLHEKLAKMKLMPADGSGNNVVRYVRLPNQINTKYQPHFAGVLEHFEPEQIFTLKEVCEILAIDYQSILNKPSKATESSHTGQTLSADTYIQDAELIRLIQTGESYHDPLRTLCARYVCRGMDAGAIEQTVKGFMLACNDNSERWQNRFDDICRNIAGAIEKFAPPKFEESEPVPVQYGFEPFCNELLALPGLLGEIQDYVFGAMQYPSRAEAGLAALVTVSTLSLREHVIESGHGLGFNEYFIQASPTGFGKESVRRAVANLTHDILTFDNEDVTAIATPMTVWKLPPSQQGIHKLLETDNAILILSDEYAEWLAATRYDAHKQEAVGYLLELYTSATRRGVTVPQAVTNKYFPVDYPRVSLFGSTTPARLAEAMSGTQARSGAYNRCVILVSDEAMPVKRYDGRVFEVPSSLKIKLAGIAASEGNICFSDSGIKRMIELDAEFERLKFEDADFAARLMEQTIKLAGLFCIADGRRTIEPNDMERGAAIRLNLYRRMKRLVEVEGVAMDMAPTSAASAQVADVFMRHPALSLSRVPDYSRKYRALGVYERKLVIDDLERSGVIRKGSHGRLESLVFEKFPRRALK